VAGYAGSGTCIVHADVTLNRSKVKVIGPLRPSTISFSDFDLIWCVNRPRRAMRTGVTSSGFKVKIKVRVMQ